MENKYKRVLAILWHWDTLKEKKFKFDAVSIQEDEESLVCCIQHGRSVRAIGEDMTRCTNMVSSNGKLIMMVHRKSLNIKTHQKLKNYIQKALPSGAQSDWKVFGGGSDYIYYDCERDTGLLNQEGDFAINNIYEYLTADNQFQKRVAIVGVRNSKGGAFLTKSYFDQVWRYYHYELKRKVYELERDLFLHFAPFTDPEYEKSGTNLTMHLAANELLTLRLSSFAEADIDEKKAGEHRMLLFDHCTENLEAAYGQPALDAYKTLKQTINGVFLSTEPIDTPPHVAIPQVRQQFVHLRSFMPERITY